LWLFQSQLSGSERALSSNLYLKDLVSILGSNGAAIAAVMVGRRPIGGASLSGVTKLIASQSGHSYLQARKRGKGLRSCRLA
jgi:hypothetical protein